MVKLVEKTNWKLLARVKADFVGATKEATKETAELLRDTIKEHWSVSAPSSPYDPPAERTGNLDSAVRVSERGRDERGRFSSADSAAYYVTANAQDGDNYHGRGNYGPPLELGTEIMEPRPFMAPAVELVSSMYPSIIEGKVSK